jgi:formamidopyrimidine-DNA glycosylase
MPEIPEVEVLRGQLGKDLVGRKFKTVAVNSGKVVAWHKDVKSFRNMLEGRTCKSVGRLGRALVVGLDGGSSLVLDLGRGGLVHRPKSAKDAKPKYTVAVLSFTQGHDLRVVDPHGDVQLAVCTPPAEGATPSLNVFAARLAIGGDGLATRKQVPYLAQVGLDCVEDQYGWDRFASVLTYKKMPLKDLLMDQQVIAGLGPVICDEALYQSGLVPDRRSDSISTIEARRLHRAIGELVTEITKLNGATTAAYPFYDLEGRPGGYGPDAMVTDRLGQPCLTCRTPLRTLGTGTATSVGCARCQS